MRGYPGGGWERMMKVQDVILRAVAKKITWWQAAEGGHAFVPVAGQDLERIFSVQQERVVAKDNTVRWGDRVWQLERTRFRGTLA
ncbi:MAG: hypothetical protein ACRD3I_04140, partial [Terriglobales bacterium]